MLIHISAIIGENLHTSPFCGQIFFDDGSYIGATLRTAYGTSIGTSYAVAKGGSDLMYLPIWAINVGISSAAKTNILKKINEPFHKTQNGANHNMQLFSSVPPG
jgi:hypothetical protein